MQTITIQNQNNKLNSNLFLHIAPAPSKPLLESNFPIEVHINEHSAAGPVGFGNLNAVSVPSLSFDAEIIDIARIKLNQLSSLITVPATGMCSMDFIQQYKQQNPSANADDLMAVYILKKK